MAEEGEGILLKLLEGENFHRLKVFECVFDGPGLYRITSGGENAEGKTALLLATAALLGGGKHIKPDVIHTGEHAAWVRGEFSNGIHIEKRFTEASPKGYLDVVGPDGMSPKKKQAYIDEWMGAHSFDLLSLYRLTPKKLGEILMGLSPNPKLQEQLETVALTREELREKRSPWTVQKQKAQRTAQPEGERPETVDVSATSERLQALRSTATERALLEAELYENARDLQDRDERISTIERKLEALKSELADAKEIRANIEAKGKTIAERLQEHADPTEEIQECQALLAQADAVQESLEPWREWDRARVALVEAKAAETKINKALEKVDAREKKLMAEAAIPVDGITFGDDGVPLLNGRALSVASGMEEIRMYVQMVFAANPDLKLCLIDEANDLSLSAMEELDKEAKARGFQIMACRLGLEGPGEIVVEDGHAKNRGA